MTRGSLLHPVEAAWRATGWTNATPQHGAGPGPWTRGIGGCRRCCWLSHWQASSWPQTGRGRQLGGSAEHQSPRRNGEPREQREVVWMGGGWLRLPTPSPHRVPSGEPLLAPRVGSNREAGEARREVPLNHLLAWDNLGDSGHSPPSHFLLSQILTTTGGCPHDNIYQLTPQRGGGLIKRRADRKRTQRGGRSRENSKPSHHAIMALSGSQRTSSPGRLDSRDHPAHRERDPF